MEDEERPGGEGGEREGGQEAAGAPCTPQITAGVCTLQKRSLSSAHRQRVVQHRALWQAGI